MDKAKNLPLVPSSSFSGEHSITQSRFIVYHWDMEMENRVRILLIEANDSEAFLIDYSFRLSGMPFAINRVKNDREGLAFLNRQDDFKKVLRPDVILMKARDPKKDTDFLSKIRVPSLKSIPICILVEEDQNIGFLTPFIGDENNCHVVNGLPTMVKEVQEAVKLQLTGKT